MDWHFQNIVLYPSNGAPLDPKLFQNPTAHYRGAPFWSWNTRLDRSILLRQLENFRDMGLGGAHFHPRTGLATPYMGEEYLSLVRACATRARELGMLAWLYDEDRWPSGFAGGLVTADPAYRARYLLWTPTPYCGQKTPQRNVSNAVASRQENGRLLARYEVMLKDGYLAGYLRLEDREKPTSPDAAIWHAYLEVTSPSPWFNNQGYVDTLNPKAIQRFIEVTHERYASTVGDLFGQTIPAIFTDEPQFVHKKQLASPTDRRDVVIPFTDDFLQTFERTYNCRLEDSLPELFWELPDGRASLARYRYHDHVAERFASAFADTIGKWCLDHGIALTGHMMEEPRLASQTAALGDAMRSYRAFQLPGIDILCDWREYTTAKQAQSAAHQYGRPGVLSELYGVTNWDFSFVGHKGQGDWQAALGVSVRVPHLAWVSMAGEAKRDYPAAIDYHSPWYRQYRLIENHFARVNVAMTRGRPLVRVGVIHPVESYWLAFGPIEQTALRREELETAFSDITHWLLFGLLDFNFISESLLPELCPSQSGARFHVGQMAYDLVIVPGMRTIRSTTIERLKAFAAAGGQVLFAGEIPELVDAIPSDRPAKLAASCRQIPLSRPRLLDALEDLREVKIRLAGGNPADSILHQIRADGDDRYVFFCNTDRDKPRLNAQIQIRGHWKPQHLDTLTGRIAPLCCRYANGWTLIDHDFAAHGHLLLQLTPGQSADQTLAPRAKWTERARLAGPVPVTLSEPNVLLLNQARWRIAGAQRWRDCEELLRLENELRRELDLPPRHGETAQPWVLPAADPVLATVELRFAIRSDVDLSGLQLAMEEAHRASIALDGRPLEKKITGWWVDEAIQTLSLPAISAGDHELIISLQFTAGTSIEWIYLLGDFGVAVAGRDARLAAPVRSLAFGDWTRQGLPFYAGNITYHARLSGAGGTLSLEASHFRNPLLTVELDGRPAGPIALAPFRLDLGTLLPGEHRLDITAYGNRFNAFGTLHNTDPHVLWYGPHAWRSTGAAWSYEYQLRPMGVLSAPIIWEGTVS